jgi:hypothetical protein
MGSLAIARTQDQVKADEHGEPRQRVAREANGRTGAL